MMNHMDTNKPENDRSVDDVEGNPSRDAAASPPDGPYGAHQSWSARNPIAGPVPSTGPAAHPVGFTPPPPLSPPPSPPGPVGYPPTALMPPRDAVAAPRRGRALWAIVAAVALALGSGSVGGVVGYTMASSESTGSPSQMVADGATLADVAEQVQPSVVSIVAGEAGGSGVVFDDDGHIITNSHVVTAARGEVEVTFSDGTSAPAQIVGTDEAGDIAVLKVDGNLDLTPIPIGDSDALSVGDTVLALGSPLGLEGSVTSGIVSAHHHRRRDHSKRSHPDGCVHQSGKLRWCARGRERRVGRYQHCDSHHRSERWKHRVGFCHPVDRRRVVCRGHHRQR